MVCANQLGGGPSDNLEPKGLAQISVRRRLLVINHGCLHLAYTQLVPGRRWLNDTVYRAGVGDNRTYRQAQAYRHRLVYWYEIAKCLKGMVCRRSTAGIEETPTHFASCIEMTEESEIADEPHCAGLSPGDISFSNEVGENISTDCQRRPGLNFTKYSNPHTSQFCISGIYALVANLASRGIMIYEAE